MKLPVHKSVPVDRIATRPHGKMIAPSKRITPGAFSWNQGEAETKSCSPSTRLLVSYVGLSVGIAPSETYRARACEGQQTACHKGAHKDLVGSHVSFNRSGTRAELGRLFRGVGIVHDAHVHPERVENGL